MFLWQQSLQGPKGDSIVPGNNTIAPIPTARAYAGSTEHNGKMYVYGGQVSGGDLVGVFEAYDPVTNTWETLTSGGGRRNSSMASVNGELYLLGGYTTASVDTAGVFRYDFQTNTWVTRASMPVALNSQSSVAIDGEIYVYGGNGSGGAQGRLYIYNPVTNTWRNGAINANRRLHAAVAIGRKMYVIGGGSTLAAGTAFTSGAIYDLDTNTWTSMPPMPSARNTIMGGVVGSKIYIPGGWNNSGRLSTIAVYDTTSATWTEIVGQPPLATMNAHVAAVIGQHMYCASGLQSDAYSNHAFRLF